MMTYEVLFTPHADELGDTALGNWEDTVNPGVGVDVLVREVKVGVMPVPEGDRVEELGVTRVVELVMLLAVDRGGRGMVADRVKESRVLVVAGLLDGPQV